MNKYIFVNKNPIRLKNASLVSLLLMISTKLYAESDNNDIKSKAIDGSIGLGSIIAVVASWSRNKSILWAIVHGLMGWIYVVYFIFTRED